MLSYVEQQSMKATSSLEIISVTFQNIEKQRVKIENTKGCNLK